MDTESNTDSQRKLASLQIVEAIEKHPDADSLELVTILGWQVITRTGEVKLGDKVIYCEIDSMLPNDAEWLPQSIKDRILKDKLKGKFHVRTIKLRGEISQGLIIPLNLITCPLQEDMTHLLNITKYEIPTFIGQYIENVPKVDNFPKGYVDKTDEFRIQSNPKVLFTLKDKPYYMTVKMDGTSGTFLLDPSSGELLNCSRNMIREQPDNIQNCPYWSVGKKYDLANKLKNYPHLCIQGEIVGPNIQKNLMSGKDIKFYVFNIVNIKYRTPYPFDEMVTLCKELQLDMVPIEEVGDSFNITTVKELLVKAKGFYPGTTNHREGLVIRSKDQKISFKIINQEYLIKRGQ